MPNMFTYPSEWATLRKAAVSFPQEDSWDEQHPLFADPPVRHNRIRRELEAIVELLESNGVDDVVTVSGWGSNSMFLRDLGLATGGQLYTAIPGTPYRRGEEVAVSEIPNRCNVSHKRVRFINSYIEWADVVRTSPTSFLMNVGNRTGFSTDEECRNLENMLSQEFKCKVTAIDLNIRGDANPQHLLGTHLNLPGLLLINSSVERRLPVKEFCKEIHYHVPSKKIVQYLDRVGPSLNGIALNPRTVMIPAQARDYEGGNDLIYTLQNANVQIIEVDVRNLIAAGGGIACTVLPLSRTERGP